MVRNVSLLLIVVSVFTVVSVTVAQAGTQIGFTWVPTDVKLVVGEKRNVYVKVSCDPDDVVVKAEFRGMGVFVGEDNLVFTKYNETEDGGWLVLTLYPFYDDTLGMLVDLGKPDELLRPGSYDLTLHMYNSSTGEEISEARTTIPVTIVNPTMEVVVPDMVFKGETLKIKIITNRNEKGYDYIYVVLDLGVKKIKYSRIALDESGNATVEIPTDDIDPGTYKLYVRDAMRTVKGDVEDWYDIDPSDPYAREYWAEDDILVLIAVTISLPKPLVTISTDKGEYKAGDVMQIEITLTNPCEDEQRVKLLWKGVVIDYKIEKTIVNKTLVLPSNYEKTYTFTWKLPPIKTSFVAYWYVALYDTTGKLLSEDDTYWSYFSTKRRSILDKSSWNITTNQI